MTESEVLELLKAAEARARVVFERIDCIAESALGWVGREEKAMAKERLAAAQALRELYENQPPDEPEH